MDQSSFLSDSSKYKKRRPIFGKTQHSPVTRLADSMSKTSSHLQLPNRNVPQDHSQSLSRVVVHSLKNSQVQARANIPTTTRIAYSQPKVSSPHIIYHQRPATPIVTRSGTQHVIIPNQQPVFVRPVQVIQTPVQYNPQMMPARTFNHTTRCFYKTQPATLAAVRRTSDYKENVENDVEVRPSVVAIQRVMKEVGSNVVQKQIKYFPQGHDDYTRENDSSCCHKSNYEDQEVSKLTEINSLLSQNYNLLYNEFYNLKKEIREEEVVEQQAFLKRSINQIQFIFDAQTNQALAQMQQLSHPRNRQPIKKVGRNRVEIQAKSLYV